MIGSTHVTVTLLSPHRGAPDVDRRTDGAVVCRETDLTLSTFLGPTITLLQAGVVLMVRSAELPAPLRTKKSCLGGDTPTEDALSGAGVEVPVHLERELKVSQSSEEVQTIRLSGPEPGPVRRSLPGTGRCPLVPPRSH